MLASKSLWHAGVVQILRSSTSKSAPTPPVFNDFDFRIALARRRGGNFVDILGSRPFATPVFRTYLCEPSKRQNYGKTQHFAQFLPAKISQVSHPRCQTSLLRDLPATFSIVGSKLELLNFLWIYAYWCSFEYVTHVDWSLMRPKQRKGLARYLKIHKKAGI